MVDLVTDMELSLTEPRGLYFVVLWFTVLIEVVVGGIEIAKYLGYI